MELCVSAHTTQQKCIGWYWHSESDSVSVNEPLHVGNYFNPIVVYTNTITSIVNIILPLDIHPHK